MVYWRRIRARQSRCALDREQIAGVAQLSLGAPFRGEDLTHAVEAIKSLPANKNVIGTWSVRKLPMKVRLYLASAKILPCPLVPMAIPAPASIPGSFTE